MKSSRDRMQQKYGFIHAETLVHMHMLLLPYKQIQLLFGIMVNTFSRHLQMILNEK